MSTEQGPAGSTEEYERQRAAYEEQLDRIPSAEMILQAVVSLLAIGGRRLGSSAASGSITAGASGPATGEQPSPGSGRDLEQVRDAIDAVRALLPILERRMPRELGPLREALSQLQFAYTRESQAGGSTAPAGGEAEGGGGGPSAGTPGGGEPRGGEPGGGEPGGGKPGGGEPGDTGGPAGEEPPPRRTPGPAESSGRLWVPGR